MVDQRFFCTMLLGSSGVVTVLVMSCCRTRQPLGDHKKKRQVEQTVEAPAVTDQEVPALIYPGSPSCHRPWKFQLSQTMEVPAVIDCGNPSCHRPWKSQLSQTMEDPAVTDHGSTSCHRPWKSQLSQTMEFPAFLDQRTNE